jgi:ribose transport system permease protein
MMVAGVPVALAVALGFGTGALIGAINGAIIDRLKLQPFIVTLAMLSLARGLTLILSNGYPVSDLPESFAAVFAANTSPDSVVYFGFGVFFLTVFAMHRSRFGIHIRSIGGSETTSYICGIRVGALRIWVYVIQALLATLAGFTFMASLDAAEPSAGLSTEWLEAIAAPIIGGNALTGGRARLFGTLLGCFILSTMRSGLNISGVPVAWQQVAIGTIIILAVALDNFSRKRGAKA